MYYIYHIITRFVKFIFSFAYFVFLNNILTFFIIHFEVFVLFYSVVIVSKIVNYVSQHHNINIKANVFFIYCNSV